MAQPDYLHNIVCNEFLIDGLVYSQASDMSPDIFFISESETMQVLVLPAVGLFL